MNTTQRKLEKAFLRASVQPKTLDKERRTLEVVFSEGSRGLRQPWFGEDYYEELAIDEKSIRMDRLKNGAPVLNAHNGYSLDAVIGVVEDAWVENGKAIAKVRLSSAEKDKNIVEKIEDGIIRKISVGYMVHRYEKTEALGEIPIYRATDWEPMEISFVPIPFDDAAQVRKAEPGKDFSLCEFPENEGSEAHKKMKRSEEKVDQPVVAVEEKKEEIVAPVTEPKPEEPAPVVEEKKEEVAPPVAQESAGEVEQKRIRDILTIAENSGLSAKDARSLIERGLSVEDAQTEIKTRWAKEGSDVKVENTVSVGSDNRKEMIGRGVENALLHRIDSKNKLTDEGREFRGLSLIEIAKDMMETHGVKTRGLSKYEIATRALSRDFWTRLGMHGTDDFPNILADVANKTLRAAYQQAPQTFRPLTRQVSVPDFKNINRMQLGEAPALAEVGEHGEFEYGTVGDSKEVYRVKRYGKMFAVTRETLVNDDMDALSRMPQAFGYAAANKESDLMWAIFTSNPTMGDSVALFHASHGNLGTNGAIGETTLNEMRKLGRLQTGLDGATLLNIMHKYLIVPAALETAAQKQLTTITANQSSSANPFQGLYTLIVEPRLDSASALTWYGAAEPGMIDVLEIAYLEGMEGARVESQMDFDTDGMKMKCAHDFGVKAIDWRGVFKNAGA